MLDLGSLSYELFITMFHTPLCTSSIVALIWHNGFQVEMSELSESGFGGQDSVPCQSLTKSVVEQGGRPCRNIVCVMTAGVQGNMGL